MSQETVVFERVSVAPMDTERIVDDQTVVVEGGRIAWIGPADSAEVPACGTGALRVDGRGKYLMPGLTDMHCHPSREDDLLLFVAHGVTTIRNMLGLPRHVLWRDRTAAGPSLGPTIHTTGPIVDGRPVRSNWDRSVVQRDEAIAAVELTHSGGYQAVKVYDQLSVDAYHWIVEAAGERNLPVVGHIPFRVGLHRALRAGQRSIEHLYGYPQALQSESRHAEVPSDLTGLRSWLFDQARHADLARMPDLAAVTREADVWNCPTLLVRNRWTTAPSELAERPELRYVPPVLAAQWRSFIDSYPTDPAREDVCALNAAIVRELSAAGAGLLVGTDAGIPAIVCGLSLHEELHALVAAGLTPYEVLRAATADAARFLGEAREWGEIRTGARADLLLLDANPLADVANASDPAGVMVRGRWLPRSELAGLLDDLADRMSLTRASRAPQERPASATSLGERLRFDVSWAGWNIGDEELVIEPTASGGQQIRAVSSTDGFGGVVPYEAGVYTASVTVDAAGVDQSASFEFAGADGADRVEMSRVGGRILVRHLQESPTAVDVEFDDPTGAALFGRPLTALFVRVGEQAASLRIGDTMDALVVGPGMPPDPSVCTATLHTTRLPDSADGVAVRRYAVDFERANARSTTVVHCDRYNRPLRVDLGSEVGNYVSKAGRDSDPENAPAVRISRRR